MRRTYNASAILTPLPARKVPLPPVDTNTRQRLVTGLGEAANCLVGHATASEVLTRVLGPGWSDKQLRRERLKMDRGVQYYQKGRVYSYDLAAIIDWHLQRQEG